MNTLVHYGLSPSRVRVMLNPLVTEVEARIIVAGFEAKYPDVAEFWGRMDKRLQNPLAVSASKLL